MIDQTITPNATVDQTIRTFVFTTAAGTGTVPQAPAIADALGLTRDTVDAALHRLAAAKVLVLAPNSGDIWAANPFCAVASGFRVEADDTRHWAICAWDALGVVAAVKASSAIVRAPCGDCGELLHTRFENGELVSAEGVIHFAVPARAWWQNIGFA